MIATPATWTADALAWLTVYTDRYVDLLLTGDGGGLAIEGPTYFAGVQQRDGAFGLELAGLTYWFDEAKVGGVRIYPDTDTLVFYVEGQATFSLTPRPEP